MSPDLRIDSQGMSGTMDDPLSFACSPTGEGNNPSGLNIKATRLHLAPFVQGGTLFVGLELADGRIPFDVDINDDTVIVDPAVAMRIGCDISDTATESYEVYLDIVKPPDEMNGPIYEVAFRIVSSNGFLPTRVEPLIRGGHPDEDFQFSLGTIDEPPGRAGRGNPRGMPEFAIRNWFSTLDTRNRPIPLKDFIGIEVFVASGSLRDNSEEDSMDATCEFPCPVHRIAVQKGVACATDVNGDGVINQADADLLANGAFAPSVTALAGALVFYRIIVSNPGTPGVDAPCIGVTVNDTQLGNLTAAFQPDIEPLDPGETVTRTFLRAIPATVTNAVTVVGKNPFECRPDATDTAMATVTVVRSSLACQLWVDDDPVFVDPADPTPPVSGATCLPPLEAPFALTYTWDLTNTGDVALDNVVTTSPILAFLGCTFPAISLEPAQMSRRQCTVTIDDTAECLAADQMDGTADRRIQATAFATGRVRVVSGQPCTLGDADGNGRVDANETVSGFRPRSADCMACAQCKPKFQIAVDKTVACLVDRNGDGKIDQMDADLTPVGEFKEIVTSLRQGLVVWRIIVRNPLAAPEAAGVNVTVNDPVLGGDISARFRPGIDRLDPGEAVEARFVFAATVDVTNLVTVTGKNEFDATDMKMDDDTAAVDVVATGLVCELWVDDDATFVQPGDPTPPAMGGTCLDPGLAPYNLTVTWIIRNTGETTMENIVTNSATLTALGCVFPAIALAPGASSQRQCTIPIGSARACDDADRADGTRDFKITLVANAVGTVRIVNGEPCFHGDANGDGMTGTNETVPDFTRNTGNCTACALCNYAHDIQVVKQVACLVDRNGDGVVNQADADLTPLADFRDSITSLRGAGVVYRIAVTNPGRAGIDAACVSVSVIDTVLGDVTAAFRPDIDRLDAGETVERRFRSAPTADVTNVVTVRGDNEFTGQTTTRTADAVVDILATGLTCQLFVDDDPVIDNPGDPTPATTGAACLNPGTAPYTLTYFWILENTGQVTLENVATTSAVLTGMGCTFPAVALSPGERLVRTCNVSIPDGTTCRNFDALDGTVDRKITATATASGTVRQTNGQPCVIGDGNGDGTTGATETVPDFRRTTAPCTACVQCALVVDLRVEKTVACLVDRNGDGVINMADANQTPPGEFKEVVTSLRSALVVWRIRVTNAAAAGEANVVSVVVTDPVLGGIITASFPGIDPLSPGETVEARFVQAPTADVTNVVTVNGLNEFTGAPVMATDDARVDILATGLVCELWVDDDATFVDPGDPTPPAMGGTCLDPGLAPYNLTVTWIIRNTGETTMENIVTNSATFTALGCVFPAISLAPGASSQRQCTIPIGSASACDQADRADGTRDFKITLTANAQGTVRIVNGEPCFHGDSNGDMRVDANETVPDFTRNTGNCTACALCNYPHDIRVVKQVACLVDRNGDGVINQADADLTPLADFRDSITSLRGAGVVYRIAVSNPGRAGIDPACVNVSVIDSVLGDVTAAFRPDIDRLDAAETVERRFRSFPVADVTNIVTVRGDNEFTGQTTTRTADAVVDILATGLVCDLFVDDDATFVDPGDPTPPLSGTATCLDRGLAPFDVWFTLRLRNTGQVTLEQIDETSALLALLGCDFPSISLAPGAESVRTCQVRIDDFRECDAADRADGTADGRVIVTVTASGRVRVTGGEPCVRGDANGDGTVRADEFVPDFFATTAPCQACFVCNPPPHEIEIDKTVACARDVNGDGVINQVDANTMPGGEFGEQVDALPGSVIVWRLVVRNPGGVGFASCVDVTVTDPVLGGDVTAAFGGCLAELDPGESCEVRLLFVANASVVNVATARGENSQTGQVDSDTDDARVDVVVPCLDCQAFVDDDMVFDDAGDATPKGAVLNLAGKTFPFEVTFFFQATNCGPVPLTGVDLDSPTALALGFDPAPFDLAVSESRVLQFSVTITSIDQCEELARLDGVNDGRIRVASIFRGFVRIVGGRPCSFGDRNGDGRVDGNERTASFDVRSFNPCQVEVVCPPDDRVPTLSEWGLILLAAGLGLFMLRRARGLAAA